MNNEAKQAVSWTKVCELSQLPNATVGVGVKIGNQQIALFNHNESLRAIDNFDPFSQANVLSRGLLIDVDGQMAVASPLLKQRFCLTTGQCFDDAAVTLKTFDVKVEAGEVFIAA